MARLLFHNLQKSPVGIEESEEKECVESWYLARPVRSIYAWSPSQILVSAYLLSPAPPPISVRAAVLNQNSGADAC